MTEAATIRLQDLRAEFDSSFARAPVARDEGRQQYLQIRAGGAPYALRVSDIGGLFVDRQITLLPSADARFLGVAGLRGMVIPVYDLAQFLGSVRAASHRWLMLIGGAVSLAFDAFDSHLSLPASAVVSARQPRPGSFIREALQGDGVVRPIIDVRGIFKAIEDSTVRRDVQKES